MRNASFGTTLRFLFLITAGAGTAGAQLASADSRAGVSFAPVPHAVPLAPAAVAADTLRSSRGQRVAVIVGSAYLWSAGAFLGILVGGGSFGECFGDNCGPPASRSGMVTGGAVAGGATIAFVMAGLGEGAYRRCAVRARLGRAAAGVAAGSVPGALNAALGRSDLATIYITGAGQLLGSVVALRSCR